MLTRKQESEEDLRSCKLHVLYSFTLILIKDIRELSSYSLEMVWTFGISYYSVPTATTMNTCKI